jgi:hypothetical protein
MDNLKTIDNFLFESFNNDVDTWFDIIADNNKNWTETGILKYVKVTPTKKSLMNLLNFISKLEKNLAGKEDLIVFLNNVINNTYKNEFSKVDGTSSVSSETLSLLRQSLEY